MPAFRSSTLGLAFARYTLSRIALFAIAAVLLGLTGLTGLYLILGALILSSVASLLLLRNQRAALSAAVAGRVDQNPEPDSES